MMPLTREEIDEITDAIQTLPQRRSGCIDALRVAQRHRGWISDETLADLASLLEMSVEELENVATFYNLIFRQPVGRHVILLCDSASCWIMGCDRLRQVLCEQLGIEKQGETTADGRFTLLPIACLGTCDHAPALMIDDDLHHDLDPEHIATVLERYE